MNAVALVYLFPPSGLTYNYKAEHTYIKTIRFEGEKNVYLPTCSTHSLATAFLLSGLSHVQRSLR